MGGIALIIFLLVLVGGFQIFMSLRENSQLGLVIPALNALIATVFGMMGTDYFIGFLIFIVLLLPMIIWLLIYKLCRDRIKNRAENDMKKSRIMDM